MIVRRHLKTGFLLKITWKKKVNWSKQCFPLPLQAKNPKKKIRKNYGSNRSNQKLWNDTVLWRYWKFLFSLMRFFCLQKISCKDLFYFHIKKILSWGFLSDLSQLFFQTHGKFRARRLSAPGMHSGSGTCSIFWACARLIIKLQKLTASQICMQWFLN